MNQIDKALKNIDAVISFLKFGGIVVFDQKDITFGTLQTMEPWPIYTPAMNQNIRI